MNGILDDNKFVSNEPMEQTYRLKRTVKRTAEATEKQVLLAGIAFMFLYCGFFASFLWILK